MAEESDRIEREIAATRADLTRDVDALADRTMPNRVVRRRWNQVKEKVMGTPHQAGTMVRDAASAAEHKAEQVGGQIADAVKETPHMVARHTQGSPIGAGLIAFGAGLLVASLLPTTEFEENAGRQLKENVPEMMEPIREPLMESGQRLKEDVSQSVGQAAEEVKQTAKESAQTVAGDAKAAARQMTDRT